VIPAPERSSPDRREPRPLIDGLDAVVRSLKGASAGTIGGVFGRWDDAVGPAIAGHVRPVKLDGAVLLVEVDEPGWATQLRFLEHDVIDRLRTVTGATVERLEVRVAGQPAAGRGGPQRGRRTDR
jgi:predicted nucleic acid-binding Zn ribbon protein